MESDSQLDVLVIGAGFSGMYLLHSLRELGYKTQVIEAGAEVGGTWYWNRYPGARCDSESFYYCYSFSPELQQEWPLLERYPPQQYTLSYLRHVADRFDIRRDVQFNTRVTSAEYDEGGNIWRVHTDRGQTLTATFLITAVGCLSSPNRPRLRGQDSFAGRIVHTSEWPEDGLPLEGKRVAVIGTGSSGIQLIPEVAKEAASLTVFQRTPQFTIPNRNHELDHEYVRELKSDLAGLRRRCVESNFGTPYAVAELSAVAVSDDERNQIYEQAWIAGGSQFLAAFNDIMVSDEANATAADFVRAKIDQIVDDPAVAARLKPTGYPIGAKRIPLNSCYYETYNRANVTLIDLTETPIEEVIPSGIRTSDGDVDLDVIVFATGFDAMTGSLLAIDLRGRDGIALRERWRDGPKTYLGLTSAGFPNLFMITGPGSPSVLSNMPVSIEQHVEWVVECIAHVTEAGAGFIEPTAEGERAWTRHVNEVAAKTLYTRVGSWYTGANVPGKPQLFMPYIGGVANYRKICNEIAENGYQGFHIQGRNAVTDIEFDSTISRYGVPTPQPR